MTHDDCTTTAAESAAVDSKEYTKLSPPTKNITVEFSGGLELLFANKGTYKLSVPAETVGDLVKHLVSDVMVDKRKDLFVVDGAVRPGILVLINEADWELEGEEAYELQDGDTILFVSTLHGG